jgi:hypothetical protein
MPLYRRIVRGSTRGFYIPLIAIFSPSVYIKASRGGLRATLARGWADVPEGRGAGVDVRGWRRVAECASAREDFPEIHEDIYVSALTVSFFSGDPCSRFSRDLRECDDHDGMFHTIVKRPFPKGRARKAAAPGLGTTVASEFAGLGAGP